MLQSNLQNVSQRIAEYIQYGEYKNAIILTYNEVVKNGRKVTKQEVIKLVRKCRKVWRNFRA